MKKSIGLIALILATFTGTTHAQTPLVTCEKDMTMGDGPLITYQLLQNNGYFTLKETRSGASRMIGPWKRERTLGTHLFCEISDDLTFECTQAITDEKAPVISFTLSKENGSNRFTLDQTIVPIIGNGQKVIETILSDLSCR